MGVSADRWIGESDTAGKMVRMEDEALTQKIMGCAMAVHRALGPGATAHRGRFALPISDLCWKVGRGVPPSRGLKQAPCPSEGDKTRADGRGGFRSRRQQRSMHPRSGKSC